jgi:hypothetical protein
MLDPIRMLALGQTKQDRYLQEAERTRLIKATKLSEQTLHTQLRQHIGQWRLLLVQHLQVADHLTPGKISASEGCLIPTGDPSRGEQAVK